ncbi:MAG: PAS domain-containing protein [Balneolales bacterium]|nr:PAS domain-containing protein [Balneolales bacterium]
MKELSHSPEELLWFFDSGFADGIWYWDLENPDNEWFSDRFWEALGYKSAEVEQRPSAWMKLADPDDLEATSRFLDENLGKPDFQFNQLIRFSHKSGRSVWMRCVGRAIYNEKGKAIRILGFHHDITSDIIIQKTKTLENELVQNGFKSPEAGYWELRVDDGTVFWSSQMYLIHGVSYDFDLTLDNCLDFYSKEDQIRLSNTISSSVENPGMISSLEVVLYARNGSRVPALVSFKCVSAESPGRMRIIGTFEIFNTSSDQQLRLEKKLTDAQKQLYLSSQTLNVGFLEFTPDLSYIGSCGYLPVLFDIPEIQNSAIHIKRKLKAIIDGKQVLFIPHVLQLCADMNITFGQRIWLGDFLLQYASKGKRNWFKAYVNIKQGAGTEPVFTLLLHNFDDEKKRQMEQREQQFFLERSQLVSGVGHYVIYLDRGFWEGSSIIDDILGIDDKFVRTVDNWVSLLTPEFQQSVPQKFSEAVQSGSSFRMTYQIIRPADKARRWIEVNADYINRENLYKTNFEPTLIGTLRDVTDQMEYIKKIEEQNAFLRKLAWSQSHEVRAPLARLIAVTEALSEMAPGDPDTETLRNCLLPTAKELDDVITRLNRNINIFEEASGVSLRKTPDRKKKK